MRSSLLGACWVACVSAGCGLNYEEFSPPRPAAGTLALELVAGQEYRGTLPGAAAGYRARYSIVSPPALGDAEIPDPSRPEFVYTPHSAAAGGLLSKDHYADAFEFQIENATGTSSAPGRIEIRVIPDVVALIEPEMTGVGQALDLDGEQMIVGAAKTGALIYRRLPSGFWERLQRITPPTPDTHAFGHAVALSGDWAFIADAGFVAHIVEQDSEGKKVQAVQWRTAAPGRVHVYQRSGERFEYRQALSASSDPEAQDGFGSAVAIDGSRAAIGAKNEDGWKGAVYTYTLGADRSWKLDARITQPEPGATFFGTGVALSGDQLAVTAPLAQTVAEVTGRAYLYVRRGGWPPAPDRSFSTSGANQLTTVALSDDSLFCGAPLTTSTLYKGRGYIYPLQGDPAAHVLPNHPADLEFMPEARNFGFSVAVDGDLAVSAVTGDSEQGGGLVYRRNPQTGSWSLWRTVYAGSRANWLGASGDVLAPRGERGYVTVALGAVRNQGVYVFNLPDSTAN